MWCIYSIFTPPHYKYHYVWLYLLPSHQSCRCPVLITLIKVEMCVFLRACVRGVCGTWLHPDGFLFQFDETLSISHSQRCISGKSLSWICIVLTALFFLFFLVFNITYSSARVCPCSFLYSQILLSDLAHLLILSCTFLFTLFQIYFCLFLLSPRCHCFLLHRQLQPGSIQRSWSCHACTQSGLRSRVSNGSTRMRVVSYNL